MYKLSSEEQKSFLKLCETGLLVSSHMEFETWLRTRVRTFFPYGIMVAVLGSILDGIIFVERAISVDFPESFVPHCPERTRLADRPLVAQWYREREPQIINEEEASQLLSPFELQQLHLFDKKNVAAHGMIDIRGRSGSYFSFSRIPGPLTDQHRRKLKLMVPQLHQVICKLQEPASPHYTQANGRLSPRQSEILQLISQGKTNREIAAKLQRKESTVRNHVHTILSNLGVANRAEATARLMQYK
jgi:transcriptional regulator EpsA